MLRVWFGDRENTIYNTSIFFKNRYMDDWITDDFAKKVILDVDHSEVIDANSIKSPVLGNISPIQLSGGSQSTDTYETLSGQDIQRIKLWR